MKKRRRGRGEGAVFFSESKGCWVGRAVVGEKPNGGPKYKEVTARSKGELLLKLKVAAESGPASASGTVGEHLRRWLEAVARPTVEATTYATYERTVRVHLMPRVGGVRLADLTPARVEAVFAQLHADGVEGSLARKVRQVFQTALRSAVRKRLILSSPTDGLPCPKARQKDIEPFTPDEVRRAIDAARDALAAGAAARYAAVFPLALATGARQSELLGLGWEHLDPGRAVMRVERSLCIVDGAFRLKVPKSKRGRRTVTLPAFAALALAGHHARMAAEGKLAAPVFCTSEGNFLDRSMLRRLWQGLLIRAGVPYRKFHNCRHTHASQLLSLGVSLVEVARRIGDHPETVLRVYAHWMPTDAQVPARLDELYGRQGGVKVESACQAAAGRVT